MRLCNHHDNRCLCWGERWHSLGLCSCAVTMATAVNAGAAIAGVRGGIGLCSCAPSVITLVIP